MNFDCIFWFIRRPLLLLFTIAVYLFNKSIHFPYAYTFKYNSNDT